MRGEQQLHDAQARLGAHGGKHVGVAGDALAVGAGLAGGACHISIILEIRGRSQGEATILASRTLSFHHAMSAPTIVEVQGCKLKLTNLEKILYPATGFTKGQVVDYRSEEHTSE